MKKVSETSSSISEYFINKPVFATILNIIILLLGVMAFRNLAVSQYPTISIPILKVQTTYPGASVENVETDLTFPLEDALSGIPGLQSISSESQQQKSEIKLKFVAGTNIDSAKSTVRDRISMFRNRLPEAIKEPVIEQKGDDNQPFLFISLISDKYSDAELTHMGYVYIKNQLRSINGVSTIEVWGPPYEMHIELDPLKLYSFGLDPLGITEVLKKQDVSYPAGRMNQSVPVTIDSTLDSVKEFENIVLKKTTSSVVSLKDVAKVKLSHDEQIIFRVNGRPGVIIGVVKTTDGNPLTISNEIHKLLPQIKSSLPAHIDLAIDYDSADFIRASLGNIESSVLEATFFVTIVIFLFLQSFRSALIPLVTIPISLIGGLLFMYIFGFSINIITLLAMVLAVGLVVDDAIVVVENIHRHIEEGLSPLEAARKGSREIGFAIVAMTLTLLSVYVPIAFLKDTIGQLFSEFAFTLVGTVIISGVAALVLSPMMCSRFLRKEHKILFPRLENFIEKCQLAYASSLKKSLGFHKTIILGFGLILGGSVLLYKTLPGMLAPDEDQGFLGCYIENMPGHTPKDMFNILKEVEKKLVTFPEKLITISIASDWGANCIITLKDYKDRSKSAQDIVNELRAYVATVPSAAIWPWAPPPGLPGVSAGGKSRSAISLNIQTVGSFQDLESFVQKLSARCNEDGTLIDVNSDLNLSLPGFKIDLDLIALEQLKLSQSQVTKAIETFLDQSHPMDFRKDGILYPVKIFSDTPAQYLEEIYVVNSEGIRVSLGSVATLTPSNRAQVLNHHNQLRSATLSASLAEGVSLGEGIEYLNDVLKELKPSNITTTFEGAAEKQKETSRTMLALFMTALIFIYCIMAIQFESFWDPFIIMFTVPLACCGALFMLWLFNQSINIYSQIGLITLIGLITKHGILLVEFGNQKLNEGKLLEESVAEAALLRFRPIIMTTISTVVGALPLLLTSGAGSEARRAIGFVLVGGMIFGTFLTLFIVPYIYLLAKDSSRLRSVSKAFKASEWCRAWEQAKIFIQRGRAFLQRLKVKRILEK